MTHRLLLLVSGMLWAVLMARLIRRELVPYLEYRETPSYRALLRQLQEPRVTVRGIYQGRERLGEALTVIGPAADGGARMLTKFRMSVANILGRMQVRLPQAVEEVELVSRVRIAPDMELGWFRMDGRVLVPITLEGRRTGPDLALAATLLGNRFERQMPYEAGMTLGGTYLPQLTVGRPSVGKRWRIHTPEFGNLLGTRPTIVPVYATIEERTVRRFGGVPQECYRIAVRRDLTKELHFHQIWVDPRGRVLAEEMEIFQMSYRVELEAERAATHAEIKELEREVP